MLLVVVSVSAVYITDALALQLENCYDNAGVTTVDVCGSERSAILLSTIMHIVVGCILGYFITLAMWRGRYHRDRDLHLKNLPYIVALTPALIVFATTFILLSHVAASFPDPTASCSATIDVTNVVALEQCLHEYNTSKHILFAIPFVSAICTLIMFAYQTPRIND